MQLRQSWREEVQQDIAIIAAKLESQERNMAWLAKKMQERGVVFSLKTFYNYANGRSIPSEDFINTAFDILGIKPKRKEKIS